MGNDGFKFEDWACQLSVGRSRIADHQLLFKSIEARAPIAAFDPKVAKVYGSARHLLRHTVHARTVSVNHLMEHDEQLRKRRKAEYVAQTESHYQEWVTAPVTCSARLSDMLLIMSIGAHCTAPFDRAVQAVAHVIARML